MTTVTSPIRLGLVALALGCGADLSPAQAGPGSATGPTGESDLRVQTSPIHPPQAPWAYPESLATTGKGPCTGISLGSVLERIRARFEEVRDIQELRPSGPRGPALIAPPAMPVGQSPRPGTGTSAFVVGYMDDRAFAAIFFEGHRCRNDQCEERQFWYFETDDQCRPRWVGHHRAADRMGGRYGTCVETSGAPLWQVPAETDPRQKCDADWSARDIQGAHPAAWLRGPADCPGCAPIVPVELVITQGPDRSVATVLIQGTGIDFLDGRTFAGTVERQRLRAFLQERLPGPCTVDQTFRFDLDFERPSMSDLPGGLGLVDVTREVAGSCPEAGSVRQEYLHLLHRN